MGDLSQTPTEMSSVGDDTHAATPLVVVKATAVLEKKSLRKVRDGWGDWRGVNGSRGMHMIPPPFRQPPLDPTSISHRRFQGAKRRKT